MKIEEQNRSLLKTSFLKQHLSQLIKMHDWNFKEIKKYLWNVHKIIIPDEDLAEYLIEIK